MSRRKRQVYTTPNHKGDTRNVDRVMAAFQGEKEKTGSSKLPIGEPIVIPLDLERSFGLGFQENDGERTVIVVLGDGKTPCNGLALNEEGVQRLAHGLDLYRKAPNSSEIHQNTFARMDRKDANAGMVAAIFAFLAEKGYLDAETAERARRTWVARAGVGV